MFANWMCALRCFLLVEIWLKKASKIKGPCVWAKDYEFLSPSIIPTSKERKTFHWRAPTSKASMRDLRWPIRWRLLVDQNYDLHKENQTHTIHVLYMYLHFVDSYFFHVAKYSIYMDGMGNTHPQTVSWKLVNWRVWSVAFWQLVWWILAAKFIQA